MRKKKAKSDFETEVESRTSEEARFLLYRALSLLISKEDLLSFFSEMEEREEKDDK